MIITCDECHTRYVVPSQQIWEDGRRVRCTSCGNEWYQEPDFGDDENDLEEDSFAEEMARLNLDDEDLEPIPESVKPLPEGSAVPAVSDGEDAEEGKKKSPIGKVLGLSAAACVFLIIIGLIFIMSNPMVKIWPNTAVVYDMAGVDIPVKGENLLFKGLEAKTESENGILNLMIKGSVINLETEAAGVPFVQISLIEENGNIADRWIVEDLADTIEAEGEIKFEAVYPDVSRSVKEVKIELVPFHTDLSKVQEAEPAHEDASHDAAGSHDEVPRPPQEQAPHEAEVHGDDHQADHH
ncbi:MAG: MJ0042-type zinc finger domain-containing protein [Pseudomonadota bacterium]|nr:MJ0042-type zinc finger domain-containing protein [Pseudomonadota bacterium]MEC8664085.1 MJ0042-type zinc finger domain-containing protein [Pseudomonadota bacterium]